MKEISQKYPFIGFKIPTEQVVSDIFDDVTDEELTDNEVIVKDVTDVDATYNDLSDSDKPEEIITTPDMFSGILNTQQSLQIKDPGYFFLQTITAKLKLLIK